MDRVAQTAFRLFSVIAVTALTVHVPSAGAQPRGLPEEAVQLQSLMQKHMIRAQSDNDPGIIPEHVYLKPILRQLAFDPDLHSRFPAQDIELVRSIPSEQDPSLLAADIAIIRGICADIASGDNNALALATRLDNGRRERHELLNQLYVAVISELSGQTRRYIAEERLQLSQGGQIGFSEFNIASFAAEQPEMAMDMLERRCVNVPDMPAYDSDTPLFMTDERVIAVPIGESRQQRD